MAILDAVLLSLVCTRLTIMSLRSGTMFLFWDMVISKRGLDCARR